MPTGQKYDNVAILGCIQHKRCRSISECPVYGGFCSKRVHGRRRASDKYLSSEPVSLTIQPLMLGRDLKGLSFSFLYTYGGRGFLWAFNPSHRESQRPAFRGFKLNSPWHKVWQIIGPMGICGATYGKSGEMSHVNRE